VVHGVEDEEEAEEDVVQVGFTQVVVELDVTGVVEDEE
jgi:hypothetical protein